MDLKAWVKSISEYSPSNPYTTPAAGNTTTTSSSSIQKTTSTTIHTPSASNWTDITIDDGAGSDEGDTFKYECKECRFICASIEELCEHLVVQRERHVVCPVCLREFTTSAPGERFGERMGGRRIHFEKEHLNLKTEDIIPCIKSRSQVLGQDGRMGVYDYRAVSEDAANLAREAGLDETTIDGAYDDNDSTAACQTPVPVSTDKGKGKSENTPLNLGFKGYGRGGQTSGGYYWEPDWMLIQKFGGVDMDALREERDGEMQWLSGFEGV